MELLGAFGMWGLEVLRPCRACARPKQEVGVGAAPSEVEKHVCVCVCVYIYTYIHAYMRKYVVAHIHTKSLIWAIYKSHKTD